MNKDEKSLLDELWNTAGLNKEQEKIDEQEAAAVNQEDHSVKSTQEETEPTVQSPPVQEDAAPKENPPVLPAPEAASSEKSVPDETEAKKDLPPQPSKTGSEKKKDIRFLAIYTTVFVIVISGLIGGSYLITSRIQREMSENNNTISSSQSTLKNIQDENESLKKENASLQQSNADLTTAKKENDALLESVGNMVEQDEYLAAAQNAYISGNKALAKSILTTIDREKLSAPAKNYYDALKAKLGS